VHAWGGGGKKRYVARPTSASAKNGQDLVDLEDGMDGWERKKERKKK
jgi:hypothetical protein